MDFDAELAMVESQEQRLVFPSFDAEVGWSLGLRLREIAVKEALPIAFDISFGGTTLLYVSMPGASPDNQDWIRRKKNVVTRFHKASYRVRLERERAGVTLEAKFGVSGADFVASGGCFPLRLTSSPLPLGTCTVSGLPDHVDHGLVVRVLAAHLGLTEEILSLSSR